MGKSSDQVAGYRFKLRNHSGLTYGDIDAYLEFRGGDKPAWQGRVTSSGVISVNAPNLWGGDKDQGGIVGNLYVMFGEPAQERNSMLVETFGDQTCSWRGFATVAYDGLYGSNNPYPQPCSHKIEKIKKGWDGGECWYPDKAAIPMLGPADLEEIDFPPILIDQKVTVTSPAITMPEACVRSMALQYDWSFTPQNESYFFWRANESGLLLSKEQEGLSDDIEAIDTLIARGWQLNQAALVKYVVGNLWMTVLTPGAGSSPPPAPPGHSWFQSIPYIGSYETALGTVEFWRSEEVVAAPTSLVCINPAHAIYYLRTQAHLGNAPTASIHDSSFSAGADRLFAEGFGICVRIDPDKESPEDVEDRICKLIGGSVRWDMETGQLRLDLARGDYVLDDLPIIGDDDIIEFKKQPTTLESAVNSVSVKYFDPMRKESIITPAVDANALIDEFGLNHAVLDFPEIPTADLAARVAQRELLNYITPKQVFDLVCKPSVYALRPNQYFRLQAPRRGIADMVCIVGSRQGGTLKSGAITLQASQDIYTMPDYSTVEVEPGVDTSPPATPSPIVDQIAFEAPYSDVCRVLSRADLAVLPPEIGYLAAVAADPAISRDYSMEVDAGAGYVHQADGDWCPTLTINEAANRFATDFTFGNGKLLSSIEVGAAGVWGNEWVKVTAFDINAGTISLGRGCADTVPDRHDADERIFFYADSAASDTTEYTDGETVSVKLLTNTYSQQLPLASAAPMAIEFNQRQVRPYPPAKFRINTLQEPSYLFGLLTVEWVHRDRVGQADQLVDNEAATIGPEAGTTYTMRTYLDDVLDDTQTGISGNSATVTPSGDGMVRIEVESERDGITSWQMQVREFPYTTTEADPFELQNADVLQMQSGETIYLQG